MVINLRKGFGDFDDYNLFKFPDNSIKFEFKKKTIQDINIQISLRSNEDLITLGLIKNTLDFVCNSYVKIYLHINYMMYQQDDRRFDDSHSFGLKFVCDYINSLKFDGVFVYHPHSEITCALLNNSKAIENTNFINWCFDEFMFDNLDKPYWVIPDSGAFKTQFKQIEKLNYHNFITCMKSRNFQTGEITTMVNCGDLEGNDCFIIDDICLGGRTFINIAQELVKKNCGKLYLIISHGLFNNGIDNLYKYFDCIYTTDSICLLPESEKLKIYKL
jgi:ribose-phosphate pyrophosphokinase